MDIGGSDIEIGYLIWPIERIVQDNIRFRTQPEIREAYMPFDNLLFFFADAGNGDQFGYSVIDGKIRKADIFIWNREDDSRRWVAPSLKHSIDWWISWRIKV